MTHTYDCATCGKRAKVHATAQDGACGNYCGTHAKAIERRGGTTDPHTLKVCDTCGDHASGGVSSFTLTSHGRSGFECHDCHKARCRRCSGRHTLGTGEPCPDCNADCGYCGRPIVNEGGRWIDPEATGDDSTWRETCDQHDTIAAEHVPAPTYDSPGARALRAVTATQRVVWSPETGWAD